ncbi:MAG: FCD domain-containing protein [Anaerolineales bacterium]
MELDSDLLQYLAERGGQAGDRLPSIPDLADELGISIGKLREQLEVARAMGLVEVRPKTGIRTEAYEFAPTVRANLAFALSLDPSLFEPYGTLRNHIEAAFWYEAVNSLEPEDKQYLRQLVNRAWGKLRGQPIEIPHDEHRDLHLTVYKRLDNVFVRGLLEVYWEAYEAVGLNLYTDYSYLEQVWTYHERMVEAILAGDYDSGYRALVEHTGLIQYRPELGGVVQSERVDDVIPAQVLRSETQ